MFIVSSYWAISMQWILGCRTSTRTSLPHPWISHSFIICLATNVTGKRQSNSVKWHNKFAVPKWGRVIRHQLCSLRRRVDIAMNNHDSLDSFWENIFFHQWTRHEGLICFVSLFWMKGFFRTVITLPLIILQTLGGNKNWIYVFALTFR